MIRTAPLVLALLCGAVPLASIQAKAPETDVVTTEDRDAVIAALARQLDAKYIFPEIGRKVATTLQTRAAAGSYASATTHAALAESLSRDLKELAQDDHFQVFHEPGF